jgi:hypothetical protein
LAAFTFVATLVTPTAALSVLVPAEAEDNAAMLVLETEVDAATAVSTLVETLVAPAAALSVLVPAEAEDSAAMLALEIEETLLWPEPPWLCAAPAWRMLAQRANTYGDLWKIIVSELRGRIDTE